MPTYLYRAVNTKGKTVKNKVDVANKRILIKLLKQNQLTPIVITRVGAKASKTKKAKRKNMNQFQDVLKNVNNTNISRGNRELSVREKIRKYFFGLGNRITKRDIVVFTQNFFLLKKANFNNIHALSTIIGSTENPNFKGILEDILAGVEAGENMYTTMEYYDNIFPYLYINMIKVGELSGSLTKSLDQAVKYLDDSEALNKRIRKILIPNIIQFVGLLVMLIVGTLVAIPTIQNLFDELGSSDTLPAVTLWFAGVIDMLIQYWFIPTMGVLAIVGSIIFYINTPKGKYNFHYFKYKMPIFGQLIFALDFSRLLKAILLNLQNGMRIQDALEVSKSVVKNYVLLSIIETSINNVLIGSSWIEPIEKSGLASSMIVEMLKIGMQTDLTEMMDKLVEYMEIDINQIMDKIMAVLPEVVYSIVGVVLIFFVIVVLVPCIQVYMGNFLFSAYGV